MQGCIQRASVHVFKRKQRIPAHIFLQASLQGHHCWRLPRQVMAIPGRQAACITPLQEGNDEKEREGHKTELSSVREIFKEKNKEGERGVGIPGKAHCYLQMFLCIVWLFN